jgi:hypothetical protein
MKLLWMRAARWAACLPVLALSLPTAPVREQSSPSVATEGLLQLHSRPEIDAGYDVLYELKFPEARGGLVSWEAQHPDEALYPATEAAS